MDPPSNGSHPTIGAPAGLGSAPTRVVGTNIELARADLQMGAARASTKDALEMSRVLDPKVQDQHVAITKVTVVLNHGKRDAESLDSGTVVDGEVVE